MFVDLHTSTRAHNEAKRKKREAQAVALREQKARDEADALLKELEVLQAQNADIKQALLKLTQEAADDDEEEGEEEEEANDEGPGSDKEEARACLNGCPNIKICQGLRTSGRGPGPSLS